MYRFKIIFFILIFIGNFHAKAEDSSWAASYLNWAEVLTLKNQSVEEVSTANFGALGLQYEIFKFDFEENSGRRISYNLLFGQATGGNTTQQISYVAAYQSFFGLSGFYQWVARIDKRIYVAFGPGLLYRSITWPTTNPSLTLKSGSDANIIISLDLKFRLSRNSDFYQTLGTLLLNASTIWGFGYGYRF